MLTKDKPVQGYVIYGEFRSSYTPCSTRQIFFTPDGFTTDGRFVPMTAFYRAVSEVTPRKQWKTTLSRGTEVRSALTRVEHGGEVLDIFSPTWAESRVSIIGGYMHQLTTAGWTMVGPPLVVEASKQDMDDVIACKTPTKIIYRIYQSRTAAGYPAELF